MIPSHHNPYSTELPEPKFIRQWYFISDGPVVIYSAVASNLCGVGELRWWILWEVARRMLAGLEKS